MAKEKKGALSQSQIESIRQALGIAPGAMSDADIKELMATPHGQEVIKHLETVGNEGFGDKFLAFGKGGLNALEQFQGTKNIEKLVGSLGGSKPPAKKADPAKAVTGAGESAQTALQQLAQYLTQGYVQQGEVAMGQQGQELAHQNAAVTGVVDQFLGGGGASSGNPAVDAAMGAYQKAYSAGEGLNSAAYANMGAANAQYLAASPEQPILNILTQGLGSGQYKQLPASVLQNLPVSIQYALSQAGVQEAGGTPIGPPKGGWPKSITTGTPQTSVGSGLLGSPINGGLLGIANPPAVTTPGNPNVPGQ